MVARDIKLQRKDPKLALVQTKVWWGLLERLLSSLCPFSDISAFIECLWGVEALMVDKLSICVGINRDVGN